MQIALAACPARNSHGKGSKVAKLPKHTLRGSKVETTTKTYLGISHNYTGFSGKRNLHHRHWLLLIMLWLSCIYPCMLLTHASFQKELALPYPDCPENSGWKRRCCARLDLSHGEIHWNSVPTREEVNQSYWNYTKKNRKLWMKRFDQIILVHPNIHTNSCSFHQF